MSDMQNLTQDMPEVENSTNETEAGVQSGEAENQAQETAPKIGKKKEKKPAPKKKRSAFYYFFKLVLKIGVTVLAVYLLFNYVFGLYRMAGNNMFPAIRDGDLVLTYRLDDYVIGDAIAYKADGREHIGRIVGIPGDEIIITELGELQVNGMIPAEEVFYPTTSETTKLKFPYEVPEDCFFILNDYRSDELDSRTYEAIPKSEIDGKAMTILRRRGF